MQLEQVQEFLDKLKSGMKRHEEQSAQLRDSYMKQQGAIEAVEMLIEEWSSDASDSDEKSEGEE